MKNFFVSKKGEKVEEGNHDFSISRDGDIVSLNKGDEQILRIEAHYIEAFKSDITRLTSEHLQKAKTAFKKAVENNIFSPTAKYYIYILSCD